MKKSSKNKLFPLIAVGCGTILFLVAFILFVAPFLTKTAFGGTATMSGYDLTFGDTAFAGVTTAWVFLLIVMIFALCQTLLSVLGFVGKPIEVLDKKMIRLCIGGCFVVLGIVVGILLFCTKGFVADTILSGMDLGAGAIVAAILSILGGLVLGCGVILPDYLK